MRPLLILFLAFSVGCGKEDLNETAELLTILKTQQETISRLQTEQKRQSELLDSINLSDQKKRQIIRAARIELADTEGITTVVLDANSASLLLKTRLEGTDRVVSSVKLAAEEIGSTLKLSTFDQPRVVLESGLSQARLSISDLSGTERAHMGHYPMVGLARVMLSDKNGQARFSAAYRDIPVQEIPELNEFTTVCTFNAAGETKMIAFDRPQLPEN